MNRLGDLLRDLRNPSTSRQRIDEIARIFNELDDREQKYQSWLRFMDSTPSFTSMTAIEGEFQVSPISGLGISRQNAQSIPDNTETYVTIDGRSPSTKFLWFDDPTGRVCVAQSATAKMIGIFGEMEWAANATGYRQIAYRGFAADGTLLFGRVFTKSLPVGVGAVADRMPFADRLWIPAEYSLAYLRFLVLQNSGGALNLNTLQLALFALR